MSGQKLVVVGLGHVGSYVLADAIKSGLFAEIGTIDVEKDVAAGEALDQAHATGLPYMNNVRLTTGDYDQCKDADIIIVAAAVSSLPRSEKEKMPDRTLLTEAGAQTTRQIMNEISKVTQDAVIIFISNSADTLVHIAQTEFDYPVNKVFGTGTMLDSSRLRYIIGKHYNIDPKSVQGYMMGEHGGTAFPVLSRVTVGGVWFDELPNYFNADTDLFDPEEIREKIVASAYDVFNLKGWTNAGVAQASISMARAILLNEHSIFPAAVLVEGEYGYTDVTFSMPVVLGREGVIRKVPVTLNEWELEKLEESMKFIKKTIASTKK